MSSQKLKVIRFCRIALVGLVGFFGLIALPALKSVSASAENPNFHDYQRQLELVKAEMESSGGSPAAVKQYSRLTEMFNGCSPLGRMTNSMGIDDSLAPTASLCINGSLAVADLTYNRPTAQSAGTGFGPGGTCTLSGSGTAVRYDVCSFDITGCAAFPTEVTATLCGPAGCQHVGNTDTVLTLYRNVAAGDPFTANGGLPAVFNPAATCTNARGLQDDLGTVVGTTNNPGGSTCNQVVTTQCVAPCTSPSNAGSLSGFRRQLGNGRFTLVVAGFSNATTGNYNLLVDAPAAGCLLALEDSACVNFDPGLLFRNGFE